MDSGDYLEHVQQWLGKSQYLSWDIWYHSAADSIFVALNNDATYDIRKVMSRQYCSTNTEKFRVSVQGVESLWGNCRFIQADWGHSSKFVLFCSFCTVS